jgi:hypothetical protein
MRWRTKQLMRKSGSKETGELQRATFLLNLINTIRAGEVIALRISGGGKSELRRARRSRNGTGGDPMDSATEKKTAPKRVRVKR